MEDLILIKFSGSQRERNKGWYWTSEGGAYGHWRPLSLGRSLLPKWLDLLSEGDLFFVGFKLCSWIPHECLDFTVVERSFCFIPYPLRVAWTCLSCLHRLHWTELLEFWNKLCFLGIIWFRKQMGDRNFRRFLSFLKQQCYWQFRLGCAAVRNHLQISVAKHSFFLSHAVCPVCSSGRPCLSWSPEDPNWWRCDLECAALERKLEDLAVLMTWLGAEVTYIALARTSARTPLKP